MQAQTRPAANAEANAEPPAWLLQQRSSNKSFADDITHIPPAPQAHHHAALLHLSDADCLRTLAAAMISQPIGVLGEGRPPPA